MMVNPLSRFSVFSEPTFLVSTMSESELTNLIFAAAMSTQVPGLVPRVCRGRKMETVETLFDEFAAAFQFPYYFGENWAAFDECLADLDWLPADAYLVCVSSAEQILRDEANSDRHFEIFVKILDKVAKGWAGGNPDLQTAGRQPTPFHVLFQVSADAATPMLNRLRLAGVGSALIDDGLDTPIEPSAGGPI